MKRFEPIVSYSTGSRQHRAQVYDTEFEQAVPWECCVSNADDAWTYAKREAAWLNEQAAWSRTWWVKSVLRHSGKPGYRWGWTIQRGDDCGAQDCDAADTAEMAFAAAEARCREKNSKP